MQKVKAQKKIYLSPEKTITVSILSHDNIEDYKTKNNAVLDTSINFPNYMEIYNLNDNRILIQEKEYYYDNMVFQKEDFTSFYPKSNFFDSGVVECIIETHRWHKSIFSLKECKSKISEMLNISIDSLNQTKESLTLIDSNLSKTYYYSEVFAYDFGYYLFIYCLEIVKNEHLKKSEVPEQLKYLLESAIFDEFNNLFYNNRQINFKGLLERQLTRYEIIKSDTNFLESNPQSKIMIPKEDSSYVVFPPLSEDDEDNK